MELIPNDYIFVHAREDKNKPGVKTMEEIEFAVKNLNEFIDVARSHNIHVSVAAYPHLTQLLPENIAIEQTHKLVGPLSSNKL